MAGGLVSQETQIMLAVISEFKKVAALVPNLLALKAP